MHEDHIGSVAGGSSRIAAFDSLRGLAACTVILSHLLAVMRGQAEPLYDQAYVWVQRLEWTPLGALWNGRAAVVLFFMLSGFVLYLLLAKARLSSRPM